MNFNNVVNVDNLINVVNGIQRLAIFFGLEGCARKTRIGFLQKLCLH
jgi:hypothetical protein